MSLCLASADECERAQSNVPCVDCACDLEKISVLRDYVQEHFPGRAVRVLHSHSTVVRNGVPGACAEHHLLRIDDECPHCAVLTAEFLEQPFEDIDDRLRRWGLTSALRVERTVVIDSHGVSAI